MNLEIVKEGTIQASVVLAMWQDYLMEIKGIKYDPENENESEQMIRQIVLKELENTFSSSGTQIFLFKQIGCYLGFCVFGRWPNAARPGSTYIQEFYITPKYRRKGYGRLAVKQLVRIYENSPVEFFVLRKRIGARLFWREVMAGLCYRDVSWQMCNERVRKKLDKETKWFCYIPPEPRRVSPHFFILTGPVTRRAGTAYA